MDLLKRDLAPIVPSAWKLIDDEAAAVLAIHLAGRRLVDFDGPHGWELAAVNTGRLIPLDSDAHASVSRREVQPLVEVRVPIKLSVDELDAVARGSRTPNLDAVVEAAQTAARIEDSAVFGGLEAAGIAGIVSSSSHEPMSVRAEVDYPEAIVRATDVLRKAGVGGPYAVALDPDGYDELLSGADDGYPIVKRVRNAIDGPIAKVPSLAGAAVLSMRGGDYELTVGQDFAIGYAHHDAEHVWLFLAESFAFRVLDADACVPLRLDRK